MKHTRLTTSTAIALSVGLLWSEAVAGPQAEQSWSQYFAVKTVIQRFSAQSQVFSKPVNIKEPLDLLYCEGGADYLDPIENEKYPVIGDFAEIALNVITIRGKLKQAGFPAELWQPQLVGWEQRAVDATIKSPDAKSDGFQFASSIVPRLNAYGAVHRGFPKVENLPCGGSHPSVNIATSPAGAQVLFITVFFYELCKVEKHNPDDPSSCPQWHEAVEGKLEWVLGEYVYQIHWPDGTVRRGKLEIDWPDDGKTITLRQL